MTHDPRMIPRRFWIALCGVAALSGAGTLPAAQRAAQPAAVAITVRADKPGSVINPAIYGQFAEHLGRSVYEGIWVGEKSTIPNTSGYRNDVIEALKELGVPVSRAMHSRGDGPRRGAWLFVERR